MRLGDSKQFLDLCQQAVEFYDVWNKTADIPQETKRAFVAGSNEEKTICIMIFYGTEKDAIDMKKFLEKKDRKQ